MTFLETSQDHYQASLFLDNVHVQSLLITPCKTEVGGNIADQTWTKDKSPYCVTNDVYVAGNLNIREGVEVRMQGNYAFEAAGRLRALGTADEPITFHPADLAVGWQGLLFRDAVPGSFFVHTIIEGSKNSGVRITDTPPTFTNCAVRGNSSPSSGAGIRAVLGSHKLVIERCVIEDNHAAEHGGGLYVVGDHLQSAQGGATLLIRGLELRSNSTAWYGAGAYAAGDTANGETASSRGIVPRVTAAEVG